jgi:8-oxo-dGTP diphosphatase
MTRDDWPIAVREALERYSDAEVVTKPFPEGFPHNEPFVAVAGLIRDPAGKALLVRHRPGTAWRDRWATPGGLVREGETPEEALRREVTEECGLEVNDVTLGKVVVMEDPSAGEARTSFTLVFKVQVAAADPPLPRKGDEVAEARWFPTLPGDMVFRDEYLDLV